ncbi:transmembrane protein 145-like [Strongylocentrotus purpuratus]|uniref:GPR180/TMEM145 transmembrane domain-containing protein n=1 Tax=Strongylocentrotus purpuratus TaxID=7668 RepID=A0A7M7NXH0_STRPU|nr:transmembrane protein 145-like [Strongylocentrotus purpuratus]
MFSAIWLLTSVYSTLRPRPKLASLYVPFLIFYCLWFLAEPIFLLVVFYALPQLETPNIKNGVYLTLSVLGHAVFFIVIRPRGLEERFPYCMPANKVCQGTTLRGMLALGEIMLPVEKMIN